MDIKQIKTLTDLMVNNDLTEIMIRDGDTRIVLRRGGVAVAAQVAAPAPIAVSTAPAASSAAAESSASVVDETLAAITSPMVGTFYAAADPESPPYVDVGDTVNTETVVCIIEAMKVFNEIKAEVAGRIESVEVKNGEPVEFGQVLFRVRTG
ncbi:MAG: acetyl-CoA carboxylase biotin carboxyl carrier protein [Phycisphaerae bacterium]